MRLARASHRDATPGHCAPVVVEWAGAPSRATGSIRVIIM
jgi:hypothetical protein